MEVVVGKARMSRKEKAKKIVEMYEAGYSYKEICEALRVSPKTIAKVLREAEEANERSGIEERLSDFELYLKNLEVRVKRLEGGESRVLKLEKDLKRMEQRYEFVSEPDCHGVSWDFFWNHSAVKLPIAGAEVLVWYVFGLQAELWVFDSAF